ncbi:MAG: RDD family protein, partial [Actinomycetales bacterium]|nr:RDD family protein [Actinomycetales bacterium]
MIEPALHELGLSEDLVTGEAVVLELRPASFATRSLAFALDLSVLGGIAFVVTLALPLI